jgi:hypothetical protein
MVERPDAAALRRRYALTVALWVLGGVLLGIAAIELSPIFLLGLFALQVVVAGISFSLKCPRCGQRLLYLKGGGARAMLPATCPRCGLRLR